MLMLQGAFLGRSSQYQIKRSLWEREFAQSYRASVKGVDPAAARSRPGEEVPETGRSTRCRLRVLSVQLFSICRTSAF